MTLFHDHSLQTLIYKITLTKSLPERFNKEIRHILASGPQHVEYKIRFITSQAFARFPATLFNRKNWHYYVKNVLKINVD